MTRQYENAEAYPALVNKPAFTRHDCEDGQWARRELLPASRLQGQPIESDEQSYERRVRYVGLPEHFLGMDWNDYGGEARYDDQDDVSRSVRDALQNYVQRFPEMRVEGYGMVLIGDAGWGKTLGVSLVAMDLVWEGEWVRFVPFAELVKQEIALMELERAARGADRDDDHEHRQYRIARYKLAVIKEHCDLLILDDVGKEHRTAGGFADDVLDCVLRSRFAAGKPTIITSNLAPQDWATYNASMGSFLFDVGEVMELTTGRDNRQRRRRPALH